MMVKAIRNHQPDRSVSCSRLTATVTPGINKTRVFKAASIAAQSNSTSSKTVATADAKMENKVHHQYSDLLDLVVKSKYLRNPEAIA